MINDRYDKTGRLVERWDTTTRTYTRWDRTGAQVETRPFTPAETARADEAAAAGALATNQTTVEDDLRAALVTLKTLIGETTDPAGTTTLRAIKAQTNATINASPAASIKALADALITVARMQRKDIRTAIMDYSGTD